MKPNEPCELLSRKQYVYKPIDLELFRKNIVSIQMNFWSIYGIWPDLNRLMSGLIWPCLMTTFQMLLDTEMSAFVEVTNVVLFPGL